MEAQFNPLNWLKSIGQSGLPSTTRLVLRSLIDFTDENGKCWPRIEDIMEVTGLSNRAVITHLDNAVASGYIVKTRAGHSNENAWNNVYQCIMSELNGSERGSQRSGFGSERGSQRDDQEAGLSTGFVDNYVDNYVDNFNGSERGSQRVGFGSELGSQRGNLVVNEVHTTNPRKGDLSPPYPPSLSTFNAYGLKTIWDGKGFDIWPYLDDRALGEVEKIYPGIEPVRFAELVLRYNQSRKKTGPPKYPVKAFLGWLKRVKANDLREEMGMKPVYGKQSVRPAGMPEEPPQDALGSEAEEQEIKQALGVGDDWLPLEKTERRGT